MRPKPQYFCCPINPRQHSNASHPHITGSQNKMLLLRSVGLCQRPYIRNSLCPRPPFSKSPLANFSRTKSLSTLSEKKTIVRNADNLSLVLYLTTLGSLRNHMESNPPQIQRKIQAERKIRPQNKTVNTRATNEP